MKAIILPGEQIFFILKDEIFLGKRIEGESRLVVATVLKVESGAITVAEEDSYNGLARIISEEGGFYHYSYRHEKDDEDYIGIRHYEVITLQRINGEEINVEKFITEDETLSLL